MGRGWPCRGSCAERFERGDEDVAGEGDLEGVVAEGLRLGELGLRGSGEAVGAGGGALERALGGVGAPRRVGDAAEGDARAAGRGRAGGGRGRRALGGRRVAPASRSAATATATETTANANDARSRTLR